MDGPVSGECVENSALMDLQSRVWSSLAAQLDGLALAPAIAALAGRGAFAALARGPLRRNDLLAELGGNPGFCVVALRLLAHLGRLKISGETYALTPEGRSWLDNVAAYASVPQRVDLAQALMAGRDTPAPMPPSVIAELAGFAAGPVLLRLSDAGQIGPFAPQPLPIDPAAAGVRGVAADCALAQLVELGWLERGTAAPTLSVAGRIAAAFAGQYRYPLSYLPSQRVIGDLLFGDASAARARAAGGAESHVDRAADIRFSTEVFTRSCAIPLFELALPLFDRAPLEAQPRVVVDVGCGEASLLQALYEAVRERTLRGRHLAEATLTMVGVEFNPVAAEAAARRLTQAGIPHLVVSGDIAEPEALAAGLAARGVALEDALHVNKSVIHNRTWTPPCQPVGKRTSAAGPFAAPDGSLIEGAAVMQNLVEWFVRWRPYLRRHGMIAIESHAVSAATVRAHAGRSLAASLEALHGLSCQYLVPIAEFRAAAAEAGVVSVAQHAFGAALLGHDFLSFDHFRAG
jgi:hypothetical protein